jgi:hypothetical protein
MESPIHSRRGQTLVEALVALSVLTVGFVGIVSLLAKSFQQNRTAADDTQATYLAAEGIEIAKNIIDYDLYYGLSIPPAGSVNDWQCSFGLNEGQSPVDYALEYDTTPSPVCATTLTPMQPGNNKLYFNPNTDLYTYDDIYTPTDFTRDVYVSVPAGSPNELDVRSVVTWTNGLLSNTISLEDHFYDWHP